MQVLAALARAPLGLRFRRAVARAGGEPGNGGGHLLVSLPAWLRAVLPGDTAQTWETICSIVPPSAYLVGGTAIAVHLRHRVSRDLDFVLAEETDLTGLGPIPGCVPWLACPWALSRRLAPAHTRTIAPESTRPAQLTRE